MFREVAVPAGVLFLHSMPGRRESIEDALQLLRDHRVDRIVCLNALDEIRIKSPAYADAIAANTLPCALDSFPIPNLGVPDDRDAFVRLTRRVADLLRSRERVLIHCGLGIGRTGMLACCALIELGVPETEARARVKAASAGPETRPQDELVSWYAAARQSQTPSRIVAFHQDAEGHWVAELSCGHQQHMRHDPPWQNRPWVITPEGRERFIGTEIPCVRCGAEN